MPSLKLKFGIHFSDYNKNKQSVDIWMFVAYDEEVDIKKFIN